MAVKITKPSINIREKLSELDKPAGIAGEAMLRAETPQEQFNLIGAGRKNLIINGAMQVAQRAETLTNTALNGYSTIDRFVHYLGSTSLVTFDVGQSNDAPPGFKYSYNISVNTITNAATPVTVAYNLEGYDSDCLGYGTSTPKDCTLSFWAKTNTTGVFAIEVKAYTPLTQLDSSGLWRYVANYRIENADTWTKVEITIPGLASVSMNEKNNQAFMFEMWLSDRDGDYSGSFEAHYQWANGDLIDSQTSRAQGQTANLVSRSDGYFKFTGVQLELGKVATPFEHRSYGEELALCQRYFWKAAYTNTYYANPIRNSSVTTFRIAFLHFPVTMRVEPTMDQESWGGTLPTTAPDNILGTPDWVQYQWNSIGQGDFVGVSRPSADAEL